MGFCGDESVLGPWERVLGQFFTWVKGSAMDQDRFFRQLGGSMTAFALQKPFVPTSGVSSSLFLTRRVARLVGDPFIEQRSYPVRVTTDDGWNEYKSRSTMHTSIVSDVGFPGVPLVMLVVGWLLGRAWFGVLWNHDVFSVCLLSHMRIMLAYASTNNRCVQSGESWLAFMSTVALWFIANSLKHCQRLVHTRWELAGSMVETDTNAGTWIVVEGH
jgi:hypothetical protein